MPLPAAGERHRQLRPVLSESERGDLLRSGVSRIVGGDYLAAHDAFETVWRSTTPAPREALQALAQVGAALYNALVCGQLRGAARTLAKARRRLEGCRQVELGLDLVTLRADLDAWQVWLDAGGAYTPPPAPRLLVVAPEDLR